MLEKLFGKKDESPTAEITADPKETVEDVVIKEIESKEHVCDENCKHDHNQEVQEPPPLTHKEAKALKRSNYEKISSKFNTAYVLQNKKTGQIVELRAASSFHACNIIGWKPNRVVVIEQKVIKEEVQESKEVKKEEAISETSSSSTPKAE